jgi:hydroxypyruvate reductase
MPLAKLREDALAVFQAGLQAADAGGAVRRQLRLEGEVLTVAGIPYDLRRFEKIWLTGMGKASAAMARPLVELLGPRIAGGVINVKEGHGLHLPGIRINQGGHPVPDEDGIRGTREILALVEATGPGDLLFCLVSGGASSLSPAPAAGLTLQDKQEVTRQLLESGAPIQEMNSVRKHLSRIKGGYLARAAYPSTVVTLLMSDVLGDDPGTIGSGPTAPDLSTFHQCLEILGRRGIRDRIPAAALGILEAGARGALPETPKAGDPAFRKVRNVVVGGNPLAVEGARAKAVELGYNTVILSSFLEGEAREVAKVHAAVAREILARGNPVPRPACVISGGETTVTVRGRGLGGRNQELALAAALAIHGMEGVLVLSGGTDGTDGPTHAAGALADGGTVERALAAGMDAQAYLARNDSHGFFHPLGDLLVTGPTLTNVMDLQVVLVG